MQRHLLTGIVALSVLTPISLWAQDVPAPVKVVPFEKLRIPVETTEDAFGYLPVTADKPTVLLLLRNGDYAQLDQYLDGFQGAARRRIGTEYDFYYAMQAFNLPDSTLGPSLMAWRDARPSSAHAHTALAGWYLARAWDARGTKLASETSRSAMQQMGAFVNRGAQEGVAALRLDPSHLVAYVQLIRLSLLGGNREESRALADSARRYHPGSWMIPYTYLGHLEPRWGGSLTEMDAYVNGVMADSALNPRLVTLRGAALKYQATTAIMARDFDGAVRFATQALAYGPEPQYYLERAKAHMWRDDYLHGLEDITQVLRYRPQYYDALHVHAALVLQAAAGLRGTQRAQALKMAREEFEELLPYDNDPDEVKGHLKWVTYYQTNCAVDVKMCDRASAGPVLPSRLTPGMKLALAAIGLIFLFNFYRWITGGFPVPGYLHAFGVIGLVLAIAVLMLLKQRLGAFPAKSPLVLFGVPLALYIVGIGLGGATWASQKRKREEGAGVTR